MCYLLKHAVQAVCYWVGVVLKACQQEMPISLLVLAKTLPIHYQAVMDSRFWVVEYLMCVSTTYRMTHLYAAEFSSLTNATWWFWFIRLKYLFSQGCNYSNEDNENDVAIVGYEFLSIKCKNNTILTNTENNWWVRRHPPHKILDAHPL